MKALLSRRTLGFQRCVFLLGILVVLQACSRVILPKGEAEERARVERSEGVLAVAFEKRPLPDIATSAPLSLVLEYAFQASGEMEMAYREWRAALERIPQVGSLPDPRLEFDLLFSRENVKNFSVGDSGTWTSILRELNVKVSQEIPGPGKRQARGELALAETRAAGERFRAAKYRLQNQVIRAYSEVALNGALTELTSDTLRILGQIHEVALHRYHAMDEAMQSDLRKIELEIENVQTEQRMLAIARPALVAELNGLLNRPADAPLERVGLPAIERPALSAADLFARAVESNPELTALRKELEARGATQLLAELERRPDYMLSAGIENPFERMVPVEFGMTLPMFSRQRIRAAIAEALAMRQATEARYRGAASDVQARVVIALSRLRDANRVLDDYRQRILPTTRELLDLQQRYYGSGAGNFLDILDTERLLIDFEKLVRQAEADRLRFYAELEEVIGEDLFDFLPEEMGQSEPNS
ncbi:MAG: TolC family protein [bacterium]